MSNAALSWAFAAPVSKSTDKFILVCLANYANADGISFPSEARIVSDTALNRKTVIAGLKRLVEAGFIAKTGERRGSTRQVFVYRLAINSAENRTLSATPSAVEMQHDSPAVDAETAPKTGLFDESGENERVPFLPDKSPVFTTKESRFFQKESLKRDTEPLEPSENQELTLNIITRGANVVQFPIVKAKKIPKVKSKTTIDPAWQPSEVDIAFADARGVDPFSLVDSFIAHHEMHGKVMASWAAAWRTWVLNTIRFNSQRPGGRIDPKEGRRAAYANPKFGTGF